MTKPTPDSLKELDASIAKLRAEGKDVSALVNKRAADAKALQAQGVDVDAAKGSVGVVAPTSKDQAAAAKSGRDWANDPFGKIKDMFGGLFGGGGDDDDDAPEADGAATGGKKSKFRWGNTIGGILGVGIAYLASNIFGGGWLGTLMFALFAIPAFMMGRNQLGGMLSGLFGEAPSEDSKGKGNEVQLARAKETGAPGQASLQSDRSLTERRTDLELHAQAYANLSQRAVEGGQLPRRNVAELQRQNQQIAGIVQAVRGANTEEEASRALAAGEAYFNDLLAQKRNAPLQADMAREIAAIRGAAPAAPAANPSMDPAIAQYYQQTYASPQGAPMMNPQVVASNLPPQAQAQLMAMRQGGDNYHYQPAQQGNYDAQRFTGLPSDQQQQAFVPSTHYGAR